MGMNQANTNEQRQQGNANQPQVCTCLYYIALPNLLQENDTYDVVANYHQRNRVPRAPDPDHLHRIRKSRLNDRHDETESSADESEMSDTQSTRRPRAKRNSRRAYRATSDDAKRFRFYPDQWRKVLDKAKDRFRLWMVTECGFPNKKNGAHRLAAGNHIRQALFKHQEDGGRVEDGLFH